MPPCLSKNYATIKGLSAGGVDERYRQCGQMWGTDDRGYSFWKDTDLRLVYEAHAHRTSTAKTIRLSGGENQYNYAMFYITALKGIEGGVYNYSSGTCPVREWGLSKINKRLASAPLREQR